MDEQQIIQTLLFKSASPLPMGTLGIGDDAALLPPLSKSSAWIITQDILAQDVHFRMHYFDAKSLAHKALHVNLSDIAAMGGRPFGVFLGLCVPREIEQGFLDGFLRHFASLVKRNGLFLLGGDTVRADDKLSVHVTLLGLQERRWIKQQNTLQEGDLIVVAGALGLAKRGLSWLESEDTLGHPKKRPTRAQLRHIHKSMRPLALNKEGIFFGKSKAVTAMTDVSDGLLQDLSKMQRHRPDLGAVIDLHLLSKASYVCRDGLSLEDVLGGGEDYALLLAVNPRLWSRLEKGFRKAFPQTPLCVLGAWRKGKKDITLEKESRQVEMRIERFAHF